MISYKKCRGDVDVGGGGGEEADDAGIVSSQVAGELLAADKSWVRPYAWYKPRHDGSTAAVNPSN